LLQFQELARRVPVPEHIYERAVRLTRKCRPGGDEAPDWLRKWVEWGPGPRAVQYLILGAKARAILKGSYMVRNEDLDAVAEPVLSHRILVNFQAESESISSAQIIRRLLAETSR
jgi:MoxR-like ATPase